MTRDPHLEVSTEKPGRWASSVAERVSDRTGDRGRQFVSPARQAARWGVAGDRSGKRS
jgi:hypothetical protein